jgi:hypothetical protein
MTRKKAADESQAMTNFEILGSILALYTAEVTARKKLITAIKKINNSPGGITPEVLKELKEARVLIYRASKHLYAAYNETHIDMASDKTK